MREGLHIVPWQWALVKSVPRAASRSMLGVRDCGCPFRQPTQSFRSSTAMSSTFGFTAAANPEPVTAGTAPAKSNIVINFFKGVQLCIEGEQFCSVIPAST